MWIVNRILDICDFHHHLPVLWKLQRLKENAHMLFHKTGDIFLVCGSLIESPQSPPPPPKNIHVCKVPHWLLLPKVIWKTLMSVDLLQVDSGGLTYIESSLIVGIVICTSIIYKKKRFIIGPSSQY